jgi:hypothetical protein
LTNAIEFLFLKLDIINPLQLHLLLGYLHRYTAMLEDRLEDVCLHCIRAMAGLLPGYSQMPVSDTIFHSQLWYRNPSLKILYMSSKMADQKLNNGL